MAAGTSGTNTQAEGLRKVLGQLIDLKLAPDADLQFVVGLETAIVAYLKQQAAGMGAGGAMPGAGSPGGAPMEPAGGGMPMNGGAASSPFGAPTPAGLRREPSMPNMDEMQRMLSG